MNIINFINNSINPISLTGLLTSMLCGFIIGMERQISNKPAGIRTSMLICMGTYFFVAAGTIITINQDLSRIVSQIITGIGFLGAGVILTKQGLVIGVTSASVIWVLAGIGILIGLERNLAAILLTVVTVSVLIGMNIFENIFFGLQKGIYKKITSKLSKKQRETEK
ncbi:MgtC/SapB family protein [bacterium]|nr:MgtC/SapB family protein [bacterium]